MKIIKKRKIVIIFIAFAFIAFFAFYKLHFNKTEAKEPYVSFRLLQNLEMEEKKDGRSQIIVTAYKNADFKTIFWDKNKTKFYNKKLEPIDSKFPSKLPTVFVDDPNIAFLAGVNETDVPTYVLGRLTESGKETVQWKQKIERVLELYTTDVYIYQLEFPPYGSEDTEITLRYIWETDDHQVYGVADHFFKIAKKSEEMKVLE